MRPQMAPNVQMSERESVPRGPTRPCRSGWVAPGGSAVFGAIILGARRGVHGLRAIVQAASSGVSEALWLARAIRPSALGLGRIHRRWVARSIPRIPKWPLWPLNHS
jgi:hypothetical protein